jgi:methanogenic corrinoid protein MtbC1
MWERRYGAVHPSRNPTNRRLYSEFDIERLVWLRRALDVGRSIGQVASLPTEQLIELVRRDEQGLVPAPATALSPGGSVNLLDACLSAVQGLDAEELEEVLRRARLHLSFRHVLDHVVAPLVERIGTLWREEIIRPVHEHLASSVIRTFLGSLERAFPAPGNAPRIVITTPRGQLHELGALLVAATAGSEGWRVTYLGPSLAADEIATATARRGARALALSLVYPCDDAELPGELVSLRAQVGREFPMLVGGRASDAYRTALEEIGAIVMQDLGSLRLCLERLRNSEISPPQSPPVPGS